MPKKWAVPIRHYEDMENVLYGKEGAVDDLHPACKACADLMTWVRLERILARLDALLTKSAEKP